MPVAALIEGGEVYVVTALMDMAQAQGREPGIKRTTLTAYRCDPATGLLVGGEVLATRRVFTKYAPLPPTGGLFWEYSGRRLLDECVPRRALSPEQAMSYESRYSEGDS